MKLDYQDIVKFLFLLLWPTSNLLSQEVYPWELQPMISCIDEVESIGSNHVCGKKNERSKVECSSITDELCDSLWNKNKGYLKVHDGEIRVGESKKSKMANYKLEDLRALVKSENSLPNDIKQQGKSILSELKKILLKERDSKDWYRSLSIVEFKWNNMLSDVAAQRAERKNKELKSISESDLTIEQRVLYKNELHEIKTEMLEAKYAKHPNWLRVKRVFSQAQKDLVTELNGMNISDQQKKVLISKLESVTLKLPYSDPRKLGVDESCSATEMNAMYFSNHNVFTVCAGYFNAFQSDSALYATVAHEISHSIDPLSVARTKYNQSKKEKSLKRLAGAKVPVFSCTEWETLVNEIKKTQPEPAEASIDMMQSLYDCLQPKNDLKDFDDKTLSSIAERLTGEEISNYAEAHGFLNLAQPVVSKDKKVIENEFFMRPDRLLARYNDFTNLNEEHRSVNPLEIFTQALSCVEETTVDGKFTYKNIKPELRSKLFNKAIQQTSMVIQARKENYFYHCGKNCSELQVEKFSKDSREDFSDWLSFKALGNFLKREKNLRNRREAAALATVDLCENPGPKSDAPDLAFEEKGFSLENHPDTRSRRLSAFNKKNTEIVDCEIGENTRGRVSCEY